LSDLTKAIVIQDLPGLQKDQEVFVNALDYSSAEDSKQIEYQDSEGEKGYVLRKYLKVLI
jgi:hypothetical protein